jgi:RNA recognition motif-containing protein
MQKAGWSPFAILAATATIRLTMEEGILMKTLIVSNFPDETTEEQIKDIFREYPVEKVTLRPSKYAVVTFRTEAAAVTALDEWRECVWNHHWLRVKPGRW